MFHCNGWCFNWTMAAAAGHQRVPAQGRGEGDPRARSASTASRTTAARRSCTRCCSTRPAEWKRGHRPRGALPGGRRAAARRRDRGHGRASGSTSPTSTDSPRPTGRPPCAPSIPEWSELAARGAGAPQRAPGRGLPARRKAWTVMDPRDACSRCPRDGETMGEIMFRGNITMKGYLKNPAATEEAFRGGWFHSGDLAVMHPDGYVKIKDRSKDVIISGGENISSQEVEDVLHGHPAVMLAAVVAQPDPEVGRDAVRVHRAEGGRLGDAPRRSSSSAARAWRASRRRRPWSSGPCPGPPPARSRSSCCARSARSTAAIE